MNRARATRKTGWGIAVVLLLGMAAPVSVWQAAPAVEAPADPLMAGFARSTVASVADAVDQVVGRRGYLAYDMRPYVAGTFVGRAATALVKPATPEEATPALAVKHSVEMIDAASPGDVGVIVMEGSLDVAAIGGLMGTAAKARGMVGMVLDGAVRDIAELRALELPVFARAASPATAVGRYASVSKQVPVECAGVTVAPGDIVVAGEDGVVIVPKNRAADVLQRAQEIDEREMKMVPFIKKYRSLQKAIEVFNRI
ncbi:MAG: RraA family protein [Luteitalea sp.]|nr:RraA family protein [Luteitalea sp.]